jgi:hypothetical protein
MRTFLSSKTSASLHTTLAANAHITDGKFCMRAVIKQSVVSDGPSCSSKANYFQMSRAQFRTEVNFNRKEGVEAMLPHM